MRGKYIIRRWGRNFKEERTDSLIKAVRAKRRLSSEEAGYCHIVKVPFRKRHPDFPLWFSLISLLLVGFAPEVDLCIHHILRIMQL